jgi:Family of unknown function (DUF6011)
MASDKQISWITSMLDTKEMTDDVRSWAIDRMYSDPSGVIDSLRYLPRKDAPKKRVFTPGIYYVNGVIYKVQISQNTGGAYAKRLDPQEGWLYDVTYLSHIPEGAKPPTFEEMFAYGFTYDVCGNCGKLLTDPESVHAKIGPVCAKRLYGLTPKQLRLRADAEYARLQEDNPEHAGIWRRENGVLVNVLKQDA